MRLIPKGRYKVFPYVAAAAQERSAAFAAFAVVRECFGKTHADARADGRSETTRNISGVLLVAKANWRFERMRRRQLTAVLFVAHFFHPVDDLSFDLLLDRDVSHRRGRRRTVPMP